MIRRLRGLESSRGVARLVSWGALLVLLGTARAEDWNRYRGPRSDGVYPQEIRTNWNAEPPRVLWRVPMSAALSSFSYGNGRVFTQGRRPVGANSREFALALDATTGKELWAVNVDRASYPNGGVGDDDGPRSTPVVEGDRVFVLTSYLKLYCFEAATGREIWRRDFPAEFGSSVIPWQNAASPLLWGDLLLLNANTSPQSLMAVRQSDGTTVWRSQDETMTQSTPILANIAGQEQAIFFTQSGLVAVRPSDGGVLWKFPFSYSTSTAASPVVAGDIVFCAAGYNRGSGAVRLQANGAGISTTPLYSVRGANQIHWASPVYHDGFIYGVFGNTELRLACVNVTNNASPWRALDNSASPDYVDYGSVLKVGSQLLVTSASGRMSLVALDPTAFREITTFQAFDQNNAKCWNNGALQDGILYARSTLEAAAFDLSLPRASNAPPVLASAVLAGPATLRVVVGTADQSPLEATRLPKLRLLTSPTLSRPVDQWVDTGLSGSLEAGQAIFERTVSPAEPEGYLRIRELP